MKNEDLSKMAAIEISLGHLILAWETLSDKFSDLRSYGTLSEEERRAIWGLADLLENALIESGINDASKLKWEELVNRSKEYIKTVPVEFLE